MSHNNRGANVLASAYGKFLLQLARSIRDCERPDDYERLSVTAACAFGLAPVHLQSQQRAGKDSQHIDEALVGLLGQIADAGCCHQEIVDRCWRDWYPVVGSALLAAAPPPPEGLAHASPFFLLAPPSAALLALVDHLAIVGAPSSAPPQRSTHVTAAGAALAAHLLQRLLLEAAAGSAPPDGCNRPLSDPLESSSPVCSAAATRPEPQQPPPKVIPSHSTPTGSPSCERTALLPALLREAAGAALGSERERSAAAATASGELERWATALVSVPDRLGPLLFDFPALSAGSLARLWLSQAAADATLAECGSHSGRACAPDTAHPAATLWAAVVAKLVLRGHAARMAKQVLGEVDGGGGGLVRVTTAALAHSPDAVVHERLWEALMAQPHEDGASADAPLTRSLSTLWWRGSHEALGAEQSGALAVALLTRRGRPLPPLGQLLLLQVLQQPGTGATRLLYPDSVAAAALALAGAPRAAATAWLAAAHAPRPDGPDGRSAEDRAAVWVQVSSQLCRLWASKGCLQGMAVRDQAALTFCVLLTVASLSKRRIEGEGGVLKEVLDGVSVRLGVPDPAVRKQAMRVARVFSAVLALPPPPDLSPDDLLPPEERAAAAASAPPPGDDAAADRREDGGAEGVLFDDEDLTLEDGEAWWHVQRTRSVAGGRASSTGEPLASGVPPDAYAPETDSDDSDATSEASVEPLDLEEGERPMDLDARWRPLQLHHLAAQLRQSESSTDRVAALQKIEQLVRVSGGEVHKAAPELVRSLLFMQTPEWAKTEFASTDGRHPERRRIGALVALLSCSPRVAGRAALEHLYSPHLDLGQRLLTLDVFSSAAQELADAPVLPISLPPGVGAAGAGGPGAPLLLHGKYRPDRTRVWGSAVRAKLKGVAPAGAPGGPAAARNRFAEVALEWASALLAGAATREPCCDVFGRDCVLLGKLLLTLGAFCKAARLSHAAAPLSAVCLELLVAPEVVGHREPFVRRTRLAAAAQLLQAVPPSHLAGALLRADASAADGALAARLQALHGSLQAEARDSGDETCRTLAQACLGLQMELADGTLASLENDDAAKALPFLGSVGKRDEPILFPRLSS